MRDPYSNTQTQFERTDRSGRWSPIVEQDEHDPWWMHVLGGAAMACLTAVGFAFAMGWEW